MDECDDAAPLPPASEGDGRLESWKEIAAYLKRDVTTVQRWERRERMPVRRHLHNRSSSVYAYRSELDGWVCARGQHLFVSGRESYAEVEVAELPSSAADPGRLQAAPRQRLLLAWSPVLATLALVAGLVGFTAWSVERHNVGWTDPLLGAQLRLVADLDGTERAAAVSRDGKFVAFLSDRDGRTDVWITQVGTGEFHNLTGGRVEQLVNPSVRTLGFSPDGARVVFWSRKGDSADDIGVWSVASFGGEPRPYLEGAAEVDWSGDGSKLVYHTAGPGDPTFIRDNRQPTTDRALFIAPPAPR